MLKSFSVSNFRSLKKVIIPLNRLNVVTGPNGSGKSNLYKSLRLLSDVAKGNVVSSIAHDGGILSSFWAGPTSFTKAELAGKSDVQGKHEKALTRIDLGFSSDDFGFCISLGLPPPPVGGGSDPTMFTADPVVRRECIWVGDYYRPASCLVDRIGPVAKVRQGRSWQVHAQHLATFDSLLSELADPMAAPEVFAVKKQIDSWRFYDSFRTDRDSPIRQPQISTRTPVLSHDGHDLVAALRTIHEIGDREGMQSAISDAFPGASISFTKVYESRFSLEFNQHGLLRPLSLAELSDGTLRYLLLVAALLSPRPPSLLVLNEPETSLHPDLLPALGRLIIKAANETQVWVVSHAQELVWALEEYPECNAIRLDKELGETYICDQGMFDTPVWHWPS